MATVLDLGLVSYFSVIFPVILVWAIVFAMLQKTAVIGKSMGINAVIAVAIALMTLLSQSLLDMVNFIVPWFAVVIIFLVLLALIFMTMGAKEVDLASAVKDKAVYWTLIGIALIIIGAGVGKVLGQSFTEASFPSGTSSTQIGNATVPSSMINDGGYISTATPSFEQNIYGILFHPKVLGLIVLFAVVIFAVAFLTAG